jgi:hypothetical protein
VKEPVQTIPPIEKMGAFMTQLGTLNDDDGFAVEYFHLVWVF